MSPKPVTIELAEAPTSAFEALPIEAEQPDLPTRGQLRARQRGKLWGRIVWTALIGLLGLMLSLAFWQMIETLLLRAPWLSVVAVVFGAILALASVIFLVRELAAIGRLRKIDTLRVQSDRNWSQTPRVEAMELSDRLVAFYGRDRDHAWMIAELAEQLPEALEAKDVIARTETSLMGPLDEQALELLRASARQVATVTAIVPLALADVVAALIVNVRMIRQIATVYGARSSLLGSVRLMRAVAAHLVATGAIALGDDLISSVAGGSVLSKLSRRFGEGLVNGALTVRVGIAAMDVCRPMPFKQLERPKTRTQVSRALTGLFGEATARS